MKQDFITCENDVDEEGRPAGGRVTAPGLLIEWQNGPLVGPDGHRREPNGAFVETVLAAALQRLEHYQASPFACQENEDAIEYVRLALGVLDERTQRRTQGGIEGTHHRDDTERSYAGATAGDGAAATPGDEGDPSPTS